MGNLHLYGKHCLTHYGVGTGATTLMAAWDQGNELVPWAGKDRASRHEGASLLPLLPQEHLHLGMPGPLLSLLKPV